MKGYRKLGEFIEVLNRRNTDMKLGLDSVRGISNTKLITETSKATVDENVISKFYVINPGEFVYNPRTTRMGDKVGLAFNNTDKPLLFTFNNSAFKIKDLMKDKLLPEYLYLFFCRSEFDRFARINSWGSATELFLFDDLCTIKFDPPDIKEQQKIVDTYNAITNRIQIKQKINENLEKTAQAIYKKMFIEEADLTKGRLGDLCKQFTGFPFDSELYSEFEGVKTLRGENVTEGKLRWDTIKKYKDEITERIAKNYLQEWDIVIGMDGSKVGKNWSLVHDFDLPLLLAQRVSCIRANSLSIQLYLYLSIQLGKFSEYVSQVNTGTTILHISGTQIEDFPILIPQEKNLNDFGNMVIPLFIERKENLEEMEKLYRLREIVVSQISKR